MDNFISSLNGEAQTNRNIVFDSFHAVFLPLNVSLLHKIPLFRLTSWSGHFVKMQSFRRVSVILTIYVSISSENRANGPSVSTRNGCEKSFILNKLRKKKLSQQLELSHYSHKYYRQQGCLL